MGALLFLAGAMFALLLGPMLGVVFLTLQRTRRTAYFLFLLPSAAAGGGIFGFWIWLRLLNGRISPPAAIERSFYLGCLPFYTLGATLALMALLNRPDVQGSVRKRSLPAFMAAFVVLGYLGLLVMIKREIELHRMAARMGGGVAGWDPVSYIKSLSSGQILTCMLLAFTVVFIWKSRRLPTAAQ